MEERETKKKRANEIRGRREEKKRGKYAIERIKKAEIENYKYRANQREGSETEEENIGCEVSWCLSRLSGLCPVLSPTNMVNRLF